MTDWRARIPGRDIWRVGLVQAPIAEIARLGFSTAPPVRWLAEEPRLKFVADPFGLWRDGRLYLFVEAYDILEPFFAPENQWAGRSHEHLAYRALHEHFPKLSADQIFIIVDAARRVFTTGGHPTP